MFNIPLFLLEGVQMHMKTIFLFAIDRLGLIETITHIKFLSVTKK